MKVGCIYLSHSQDPIKLNSSVTPLTLKAPFVYLLNTNFLFIYKKYIQTSMIYSNTNSGAQKDSRFFKQSITPFFKQSITPYV